jgi:hypothetical protein
MEMLVGRGLAFRVFMVAVIAAASTGTLSPNVQAQEYLGQMRAADCINQGGSPDSSITSDDEPDPIRNCWRHHSAGSGAGGSGGTTNGGGAVTLTPAPQGPSDAAIGLQVGGAALNMLRQLIQSLDSGEPVQMNNPYAAEQAEIDARKAAEIRQLREDAHAENERGRKAAEDGRTTAAMAAFALALDKAEQAGDYDNIDIYRENMNLMKAYIAYDSGILAWKNGRRDAANKRFNEAFFLAREAERESLAQDMRRVVAELQARAGATTTSQQQCSSINGELYCQ